MSTTVTAALPSSDVRITLGAMLTLTLVGLLVARELAAATPGDRAERWGRVLTVGIVPLFVSFVVIVGVKFASALH